MASIVANALVDHDLLVRNRISSNAAGSGNWVVHGLSVGLGRVGSTSPVWAYNPSQQSTYRTQCRTCVLQALERARQAVRSQDQKREPCAQVGLARFCSRSASYDASQPGKLLAVPDGPTLKGKRDYVILALLVGCALRRRGLASPYI
jgi:hypothetical protein